MGKKQIGMLAQIVSFTFIGLFLLNINASAADKNFFGINTTSKSFSRDNKEAASLGLGIMRIVVSWKALEPKPGNYAWQNSDKAVSDAHNSGTQLLLQLMCISDWGTVAPAQERGIYHSASMPKDISQWTDFLKALATRYKGQGVSYEIGNEVNAVAFWNGTKEEYAEFLKASYNAIKSVDSQSAVLPSAMACGVTKGLNTSASPESLKAHDDYLKVILATGAFDAVNMHNYYFPSDVIINQFTFQSYLEHFHKLMDECGVSTKPIWITETGYPSQPVDTQGAKTNESPAAQQARWLKEAYSQAMAAKVERMFWILMYDREESYFGSMGLIDSKEQKRPAWQAMKDMIGGQIASQPAQPVQPAQPAQQSQPEKKKKKSLSILRKVVHKITE